MNVLRKIPAGSLQFVVMISAVIALLLGAFVLLVHAHSYFKKQSHLTIETVKAVDRGFDRLLENGVSKNGPRTFQDTKDPRIDLTATEARWGVFEMLRVEASHQNKRFGKIALVGGLKTPEERISLYLQDNRAPLVLVGNSKVVGDAHIPRSGVKPGNIAGTSYYGNRLIRGRSFVSEEALPKIESGLVSHLESLLKSIPGQDAEFIEPDPGEPFFRSFSDKPAEIYQTGTLRLSGLAIQGNVIVRSKTKIIVDASSNLQDILLIAPEVVIRAGSKGNIQVIASKRVEIGESVHLQYPSAIAVIDEERAVANNANSEKVPPAIQLMKDTKIQGALVYLGPTSSNSFSPQVVLEEKSTVQGELYCEQNLELRGAIHGSAYVGNLVVREAGSIYRDHLYNATIDASRLPESFAGHLVNSEEKTIVQWLY